MIVKREVDPEELEFWGGAKAKMDDATDEQRQLVYARLKKMFVNEIPTYGEVNDFVWFKCNDIFYTEDENE